ncbi:MAG: lipid A biosynthesis lauroyl acyltransferase [Phycisphaerales bacterium]|nr:MAG: lipid A biosynthesis lauroyl acyltransferase [Phycisphaerales bacterium]
MSRTKHLPNRGLPKPVVMAAMAGLRIGVAALAAPTWPVVHRAASAAGRLYATSPANARRLERAREHLRIAFPSASPARIDRLAVASFEHLFVLGAEIARSPRCLNTDSVLERVSFRDVQEGLRAIISGRPCILLTGHCGNWEVLSRTAALLGVPMHAVYRPLDFAPLDDWIRRERSRPGVVMVDKFGAIHRLPKLMEQGACPGFVADQNAGDRGVFVPYFGRLTSSYKSIGLLAMRFGATIICGAAHRVEHPEGLARFRFTITDAFGPQDWNSHPDPMFYLTARYRRALELAVRQAPEQYLWMYRIWKSRPRHERLNRPFPARLLEHLRLLPWLSEQDVARIVERSDRDRAAMA